MNFGTMSNLELIGFAMVICFLASALVSLICLGVRLYRLTRAYKQRLKEEREERDTYIEPSLDWIDWEKARK